MTNTPSSAAATAPPSTTTRGTPPGSTIAVDSSKYSPDNFAHFAEPKPEPPTTPKDAYKGVSVKPSTTPKPPPSIPSSPPRDPAELWRNHGKVFRAHLIVADEQKGGNIFTLSNNCSIERYYKVAERVSLFVICCIVAVVVASFAHFYFSSNPTLAPLSTLSLLGFGSISGHSYFRTIGTPRILFGGQSPRQVSEYRLAHA
jgi:hypothetical protein